MINGRSLGQRLRHNQSIGEYKNVCKMGLNIQRARYFRSRSVSNGKRVVRGEAEEGM
jgi:hypothetical protein